VQTVILTGVCLAAVGAGVLAFALQGQRYLFAKFTHPADLAGGHADHEGVGFDVFVDHGACAHKGMFTNGDAAHYGAVGPERGAFFDQGVAEFVFALNQGAARGLCTLVNTMLGPQNTPSSSVTLSYTLTLFCTLQRWGRRAGFARWRCRPCRGGLRRKFYFLGSWNYLMVGPGIDHGNR
jgi:hypothetical protein